MMTEPDAIQRRWARVVGFSYVFALLPSVFAEFYVSGRLVSDNAIVTAQNIIAHERLFRLGIASNLLVFAADVVLVTALYVVLEKVNRRLALLATFFRLIETTILFVAVLNDFYVLRLLSGASYLTTVNSDELAALARVSIGAHGSAYGVALLVFGFGSPVFCYLWLRSGYIPKPAGRVGIARLGLDRSLCFRLHRFPRAYEGDHRRVLRRSDLLVRADRWFVADLQGHPARHTNELDMTGRITSRSTPLPHQPALSSVVRSRRPRAATQCLPTLRRCRRAR